MSFEELRNKYPNFIYENYKIEEVNNEYVCTFYFEIPGLTTFEPVIKFPIERKDIDKELLEYLVFHIGLVELISYYKCTCSPNIIVKAGFIDEEQISWFKKLYYYGLGEFMYVNHIEVDMDELFNIVCTSDRKFNFNSEYNGSGNMIAIGGGKDSIVSLNILKGLDNRCFMINPKDPQIEACNKAGLNNYYSITRILDKKIIDLNREGFLNGHTPFSALVAFVSFLACYLNNRKYIVLSNEGSANEPTILGTKINHQYSKTYEFECDFNDYVNKYFKIDIKYFSLLRCLSEFQIAMLFSTYKEYHNIFKSCNVGSKSVPWTWCGKCPKCLFVYIILSPFLSHEELLNIFGHDLYEDESLLKTFLELLGYSETKPFECIGTYSEVRYAVSLAACKYDKLPYLLDYYKNHYSLELDVKLGYVFNDEHSIPEVFLGLVKDELSKVEELYDK